MRSRAGPGSGTRSRNRRSSLLTGRSATRSARSAPTRVRTSVTRASISWWPSARATETRWCPSRTKWTSPIRRTSMGGIASPARMAAATRSSACGPGPWWAELAVEARLAVDGADDRVQRDDLQAEVALADAPECRDDLVEGEDDVDVALADEDPCHPGHDLAPP